MGGHGLADRAVHADRLDADLSDGSTAVLAEVRYGR